MARFYVTIAWHDDHEPFTQIVEAASAADATRETRLEMVATLALDLMDDELDDVAFGDDERNEEGFPLTEYDREHRRRMVTAWRLYAHHLAVVRCVDVDALVLAQEHNRRPAQLTLFPVGLAA